MTTFLPIILQCPLCKQKMYNYELASYTVYRSTVFSDSKTITEPFISNDGAIKICPTCDQPLWAEDAKLNIENPYDFIDIVPKAMDIFDLPFNMTKNVNEIQIKFYKKLLEQGFAYSNEKKYYLRIRLWWAINDLVRYRTAFQRLIKDVFHPIQLLRYCKNIFQNSHLFKSYSDLFMDNLSQLIKLTDPKTGDDYFMLAEMHREMGSFHKAKMIISKVKPQNSVSLEKLKKHILFRRKIVIKL